jgi:Zn-dependent peptidase ImmA (M78 family)
MLAEIPAEQARAALERVAGDLLAYTDVKGPPVDAVEVAARLGLVVARDSSSHTRARFVRVSSPASVVQPTILLADDPRPERRQWAVAHEIGEAHAHEVFALLDVDPRDAALGAREAVANRLAGCLLLPRPWLLAVGAACDWDLFDLKATFTTASHELIARRMLEMDPPAIITLWDQDRPQWRHCNTGGRTPPVTPAEHAARRAAHDLGRATRCDAAELPEGVDDIRAWPIHEPEWKREIVRTALTDSW